MSSDLKTSISLAWQGNIFRTNVPLWGESTDNSTDYQQMNSPRNKGTALQSVDVFGGVRRFKISIPQINCGRSQNMAEFYFIFENSAVL